MASNWQPNTEYSKGDLVIYNSDVSALYYLGMCR